MNKGEKIRLAKTRHGESKNPTAEYCIWRDLVSRCRNERHHAYAAYGGRGITVSWRWVGRGGYENFLEDMGRRPTLEHSLDRKDNDLGYSKENCRWATRIEQQNNTRSNKLVTFDGRTQSIAQWAREKNLNHITLRSRLRQGWPLERAMKPTGRKGKGP